MNNALGIPDDVFKAATLAGKEAQQAFFDAHPEPTCLDFSCATCGAEPGVPCRMRRQRIPGAASHRARQNRWGRAFDRRQGDAVQADDDGFNAYVRQWREETGSWRAGS